MQLLRRAQRMTPVAPQHHGAVGAAGAVHRARGVAGGGDGHARRPQRRRRQLWGSQLQRQQQSLLAAATAASCPEAQLQQGQAAQALALLVLVHLLCPQDCRTLPWSLLSCSSL